MPLWNFVAAHTVSPSGFSDQVDPGNRVAVGESRATAFRAEMPRQTQQQLYWRGTVFNSVEGKRWVRVEPPPEHSIYKGRRIIQTIYLEPGSSRVLPALDAPAAVSLQRSRRSSDGVYELQRLSGKRLNYRAESISTTALPVAGEISRSFYMVLPDIQPPRIRKLAADIRRSGNSDAVRLEQLETYFRNGGFRYSRTGLPTGEQALEQFLFDMKQGHCEFFAASFALLLRGAGVPARLVGGYLGGEYNELGGYYLVSEDMAHVWVEAFITGKGWVRVDPSSFARNAGTVWGNTPSKSLFHKIRLMLDTLNHTWDSAVITYDFERQIAVVRTAGTRLQGIDVKMALRSVLQYFVIVAGAAGIFMIMFNRKRLFQSRDERLLRAFYRRVEHDCGIHVERGRVGLFELADRTGSSRVRLFVDTYAGVVYRDRQLTDDEYVRLRQMIRSGFRADVC
jgi:transglutaminase-like putative cysteine protease